MGEEKIIMGCLGAMIGLTMAVGIIGMYAPTVYTCPICGATFSSIPELETHFESEHPSEPIDIIWE